MTLADTNGARVVIPMDRVTGSTLYALRRARIDPGSVADHEKLGDWAAGRGLEEYVVFEYQDAVRLAGRNAAPALVTKLTRAEKDWAAKGFARVRTLEREEMYVPARNVLTSIREDLPSTGAAKKATHEITQVDRAMKKASGAETRTLSSAIRTGRLESAIGKIRSRIEQADNLYARGRTNWRTLAFSVRDYRGAIAAYRSASAEIGQTENLPGAETETARFDRYSAQIDKGRVKAWSALGQEYLLHGNVIRADHALARVTRLDPTNHRVEKLRSNLIERQKEIQGSGYLWWPRYRGIRHLGPAHF
jgi:tetratricopeptide (TPR) repeat protein